MIKPEIDNLKKNYPNAFHIENDDCIILRARKTNDIAPEVIITRTRLILRYKDKYVNTAPIEGFQERNRVNRETPIFSLSIAPLIEQSENIPTPATFVCKTFKKHNNLDVEILASTFPLSTIDTELSSMLESRIF